MIVVGRDALTIDNQFYIVLQYYTPFFWGVSYCRILEQLEQYCKRTTWTINHSLTERIEKPNAQDMQIHAVYTYIYIICIYVLSNTIIWNIIHVNKQMKIPELGVGCNRLWATQKFPHQAWRKTIVYSPPSSNIQKYPLLFPNPLICFKFHRFELFFSVCNPPYLVCWLSWWASLQVMLRIQVVWSKLYYRSEIRKYHKISWVIHAIYNHY